MKELIEYIAKSLVDDPEAVEVDQADGDPLATLFVHDARKAKAAADRIGAAFSVASRRPKTPELVIETIRR